MIAKRKEEIHTAAARLFGEKGYAASSVRDIAQAVGLGAASLYNHIDSKDELLTSICFRCAHAFLEGMQRIEAEHRDPVDKIRALIALHIHIAWHDQSSVTVFNDEWRHLQEPHLTAFLRMRRNYETTYIGILRQGMEQGLLRKGDPWLVYQLILSSLHWLHLPAAKKTRLREEELTKQIASILIKGIVV